MTVEVFPARAAATPAADYTYDVIATADHLVLNTDFDADGQFGVAVETAGGDRNVVTQLGAPNGSELKVSNRGSGDVKLYIRNTIAGITSAPIESIFPQVGTPPADGGFTLQTNADVLLKKEGANWYVRELSGNAATVGLTQAQVDARIALLAPPELPTTLSNVTDSGVLAGADDATGVPTTITGQAPLIDNANTQAQLIALATSLTGLAHTAITSIDLKDSGTANQYIVEITWTDGDGNTQTTTDPTPITLSSTGFVAHNHNLADINDAGTAAALDVPATAGVPATAIQVVRGDDPRLDPDRVVQVTTADLLAASPTLKTNQPLVTDMQAYVDANNITAERLEYVSPLGPRWVFTNLVNSADNQEVSSDGDPEYYNPLAPGSIDPTTVHTLDENGVGDGIVWSYREPSGNFRFDPVDGPRPTARDAAYRAGSAGSTTTNKAPQTITLTNGTASYPLTGGQPATNEIAVMEVAIGGASNLVRPNPDGTASTDSDWSVVGGNLIFAPATAALYATGRIAQVTY